MKRLTLSIILSLTAVSLLAATLPEANAAGWLKLGWPGHTARPVAADAPVEAPLEDGLLTECEPTRLKVVRINQSGWLLRSFKRPRSAWLKRRYRRCLERYHQQEFDYLNKATINLPPAPTLPPLTAQNTPSGATLEAAAAQSTSPAAPWAPGAADPQADE